jgi:Galactose oxidase, central domain
MERRGRRTAAIGSVLILVATIWATGSALGVPSPESSSGRTLATSVSGGAAEVAAAEASLNLTRPPSATTASGSPTSLHWLEMSSNATSPAWRSGAALAFDPKLDAVVLFGGYFVQVAAAGDTWEFSSGAWSEFTPSPGAAAPAPRWSASLVYDPALGSLVLFGGRNTSQFFNDTWLFTASGWTKATTPSAPSPRLTTMTYDANLSAIVLYGGAVGNLPAGSESPWSYYTDTWEFSGGFWQNVTDSVGVGPHFGDTALVYDPSLDGDLLLGGANAYTLCAPLVETWKFADGRWTNLSATPTSGPGGLQGLAGYGAAYDAYLGAVVTFGGNTANGGGGCYSVASTWEYVGGGWTNVTASVGSFAPAGRASIQLAYDPAGEFALLFGGNIDNTYDYLGDTWALTSNSTIFAPPPSSGSPTYSTLGYWWPGVAGTYVLIAVAAFVVGLAVGILLVARRPPSAGSSPNVVRGPPPA